jgi:hypothetical protein
MTQVIYHLDNGEVTLAILERIDGIYGDLKIDLTVEPASKYVGQPEWFDQEYVTAHKGIVPDCATHGTDPGQWEHLNTYLLRTTQEWKTLAESFSGLLVNQGNAVTKSTILIQENDNLRHILAISDLPCLHCGLPADDQTTCQAGFPGCARADDLMHGHCPKDGLQNWPLCYPCPMCPNGPRQIDENNRHLLRDELKRKINNLNLQLIYLYHPDYRGPGAWNDNHETLPELARLHGLDREPEIINAVAANISQEITKATNTP